MDPLICLQSSHIKGLALAKYILSNSGYVNRDVLSQNLFNCDDEAMDNVINKLVQVNVLRYTQDSSTLTWYSRMIEEAVKEWINQ